MILRTVITLLQMLMVLAALLLSVQQNGSVHIDWAGKSWDFPLSAVLIALLLLVLVILAVHRLMVAIAGLPQTWHQQRQEKRYREGFLALTNGLVAVAANDLKAAEKAVMALEKNLKKVVNEMPVARSLVLFLQAQVAQLKGDELLAQNYFGQLSNEPVAGFLGVRGQLVYSLKNDVPLGQLGRALALSQQAEKHAPSSEWAWRMRMLLEARAGNWDAARQAIENARRYHALGAVDAARWQAKLWLAQAQQMTDPALMAVAITHAWRADFTFSPAAIAQAENLCRQSGWFLLWQVQKIYHHSPNLAVIAAWQKRALHQDSLQQLQHLQKLIKILPAHPVSQTALLAAYDAANLTGQAQALRQQINQLVTPDIWQCQTCRIKNEQWTLFCPQCGEADVLMLAETPAHSLKIYHG